MSKTVSRLWYNDTSRNGRISPCNTQTNLPILVQVLLNNRHLALVSRHFLLTNVYVSVIIFIWWYRVMKLVLVEFAWNDRLSVKHMTPFIKLLSKQYVGLCVFSLPIFLMMIEIMSTLSCYHHQIGSRNYYPMFRARSQNSGMRCMPLYILLPNGCSTSLLVLNNLNKKNCSLVISEVSFYTHHAKSDFMGYFAAQ